MGIRLIDEFMAKSGMDPCEDFRETAEAIAKAGFRMFLGISATVTSYVANVASTAAS
jgi:trafficking protein particle complex subunit 3